MSEIIPINEQVSLTPFLASDKQNLVLYLNDPVIYKNTLRIPSPYTEADADSWIENAQAQLVENGRTYNWAIRHAQYGLIGGTGAFLRAGVEGHLDEIGYWLAAPFRGKGLMTEVVIRHCAWLFENRPALVRIEAKVHADNPASVRVLEKSGFEREGFARKHSIKNGVLIDVYLLALIRC